MDTKERMKIKGAMLVERGKKCEWCRKERSTDMHEIVNRNRVSGNQLARDLTFRPEICSLLCRTCHSKAHNTTARYFLLDINILRYGKEKVAKALQDIRDVQDLPHSVYIEE